MKIVADLHCHTLASTHAYSSIAEYVQQAKKLGLFGFACTDHAPNMPDGCHIWHFMNLIQVPDEVEDVRIFKGIETNIKDHNGNIDVDHEMVLSESDMVIASYHGPVTDPGTIDEHTHSYLQLAKHPYVDMIGHSGTQAFAYHYEPVIKAMRDNNKIIEINSNSFDIREGAKENCVEIALLCKKLGAPISVNSDCHSIWQLGHVNNAIKVLEEMEFPQELIINTDTNRLLNHLNQRKEAKRKVRNERVGY